ncbi:M48 family metallopeptidase [Bacillus sp. ISL-4]|uniref:M48 family metallopeptidase n=1 Tax=Bacillus sp. ISL-4 TaxID=2819125 RepID=UPI001BEB0DE0|nr:SprT family zinc-dependent metalloprotease [Bacillus sp. ISL-4]MBT2663931.1 M48 family metallopeptidase [Bacillus sp. ISL-4]MBT2672686.1 M48 family metallopeptidase [Streptomyces sp. ISL-14]
MPTFQYGTTTIEYDIEYADDKKDVSIIVEWMEGIRLIAPIGITDKQVTEIIHKKAPTILQKLKEVNEIVETPLSKEFVSGEKFTYLGRNYRLKVYREERLQKATLAFIRGRFIATIPYRIDDYEKRQQLNELFKAWYLEHGKAKIQSRLELYCAKMGVAPNELQLKEQRMRWGTCTPEGNIYLNWRILMSPMPIIDYVLVHELAHLKYMNHSKDYWNFVRFILPDYKQRKEWLRINGPTLTFE